MDKGVFNVPGGETFLETLSQFLIHGAKQDPLHNAKTLIFLPTRRACRHLTENVGRLSQNHPIVLPRMIPITDIPNDLLPVHYQRDLVPAVNAFSRLGLLSKLVYEAGQKILGVSYNDAMQLASSLIELLDEAGDEGVQLTNFKKIVPEVYAEHWQKILNFFEVLTDKWPRILKEKNVMDPAYRRTIILEKLTESWQKEPPKTPIIGAGLTGTLPSVARLLKSIKDLPRGLILIPGLDHTLDEAHWQSLPYSHPQYALSRLLKIMDITRSDIKNWSLGSNVSSRQQLFQNIFHPYDLRNAKTKDLIEEGALKNITLLEVSNDEEEASSVAMILRGVLEAPQKTGALITPDRTLAKRVLVHLRRWGLSVDDSAGTRLCETLHGRFFALSAALLFKEFDSVTFLSFLKHPFCRFGMSTKLIRSQSRDFEKNYLRGKELKGDPSRIECYHSLWSRVVEDAQHAWQLQKQKATSLKFLIEVHVKFCDAASKRHQDETGFSLWQDDIGQASRDFFENLLKSASDFTDLRAEDYPGFLQNFLASERVRQPWGHHPRLFIYGPLEARLMRPDVVVLGGLNEGVWPKGKSESPWLSNTMKTQIGLPDSEQNIGFMAHDFCQFLQCDEVYLSRSQRSQGTPTFPSRWVLRLKTVLKGVDKESTIYPAQNWLGWRQLLDQPKEIVSVKRPKACPPVSARPKKLRVTQIDLLSKDPYGLYVDEILKLRPLSELGLELNEAFFGSVVHKVLEKSTKLKDLTLENLESLGMEFFAPHTRHPKVTYYWMPRFRKVAENFLKIITQRSHVKAIYAEIQGANEVIPGFTLTTKIDRLELHEGQAVKLIDYKTGKAPSYSEVQKQNALQLPLEGLLVQRGALSDRVSATKVIGLEYWQLQTEQDEAVVELGDVDHLIQEAQKRLRYLVEYYDDPSTAYRPPLTAEKTLYPHLARNAEWLSIL